MIKKRHQFIYTKNINKPEYNFYQDSKNEDFKVYEYLLETNFENDEYREFYEYFKNLYRISDRLFKFIIEELKKANIKDFGEEVLVDFKDAPKYERFIPDKSLEIGKPPKELPRNVQVISGRYLVKIMIDKVIFKQIIDLKTPIENVIKVRDEMRKKERLLKDFEMDEILSSQ